jgi:hypothetical protein
MILRSLHRTLCVVIAAFLWSTCAATPQESKGWTASAGMVPTCVDPERPDARIFHVDDIKDGADPATRPPHPGERSSEEDL